VVQEIASRMKNGRSRAARMLIEGVDPDEVETLQREWEARQILAPYILSWFKRKKAVDRYTKDS